MDLLKMYSLLKMVIFHCHVSLLECIYTYHCGDPVCEQQSGLVENITLVRIMVSQDFLEI